MTPSAEADVVQTVRVNAAVPSKNATPRLAMIAQTAIAPAKVAADKIVTVKIATNRLPKQPAAQLPADPISVPATMNHRDGADAAGGVPGSDWTNNRSISRTRNQRNPAALMTKPPMPTNHRGEDRDVVGAADVAAKHPMPTDPILGPSSQNRATMIAAVLDADVPGAAVPAAKTRPEVTRPDMTRPETIPIETSVTIPNWTASQAD